MLGQLALGVTGAFYMFLAYEYIFNLAHLFSVFGYPLPTLSGATGGIITVLSRYLGLSCFIFAFILLHMIPQKDKVKSGLRTSSMVCACFGGAAIYRAFIEEGVPALAVEATKKNVYVQCGLLALNVIAMTTTPKAKKA